MNPKLIITIISILFFGISNSQSKSNFLIDDIDKLYLSGTDINEIISLGSSNRFELARNSDGGMKGWNTTDGEFIRMGNYDIDSYLKFIPSYSVGSIIKDFFMAGSNNVWKVYTEYSLFPYSNVNSSSIYNAFERIKKEKFKYLNKNKYQYSKMDNVINFKTPNDKRIDILEKYYVIGKCKNPDPRCKTEYILSFGTGIYDFINTKGESRQYIQMHSIVEEKSMMEFNKKLMSTISTNPNDGVKSLRYKINGVDMRDINEYDLKAMINFFIDDYERNVNQKSFSINRDNIDAKFTSLDENQLAVALGYDDDDNIVIRVDPVKWSKASKEKRWYILYHELGHDILNLDHGEGGKMMFNFVDRDYTWDEFFEDRKYMFDYMSQ